MDSDFETQIGEIARRSPWVDGARMADMALPATFTGTVNSTPNGSVAETDESLNGSRLRIEHQVNGQCGASEYVQENLIDKSVRIKDKTEDDRPRERLMEFGASNLTNSELLALIIGSGTRGRNVINVADELLYEFEGPAGLSRATPGQMMQIDGIKRSRACAMTAAFELGRRAAEWQVKNGQTLIGTPMSNGSDIARHLTPKFRDSVQEEMWVVLLDVRNRYRGKVRLYIGCCDQLTAKTGEILSRVVERNSPRFAIMHNHPSGKGDPSTADIAFTRRLVEASKILDVEFVDHVVLGENDSSFVSMRESELVDFGQRRKRYR